MHRSVCFLYCWALSVVRSPGVHIMTNTIYLICVHLCVGVYCRSVLISTSTLCWPCLYITDIDRWSLIFVYQYFGLVMFTYQVNNICHHFILLTIVEFIAVTYNYICILYWELILCWLHLNYIYFLTPRFMLSF